MRTRLLVIAAGLVLAIAAAAGARSEIAARKAGRWIEVRKESLIIGVPVSGELESIESSSLGPPQVPDKWDFKIAMLAPEGSEVKEGQPVLAFDTSDLDRERLEKLAERDSAQKEIERATADLALKRRDESMLLAEAEAGLRRADLKLDVKQELMVRNERRNIEIDRDTLRKEVAFRRGRLQNAGKSASETLALSRATLETAQRRLGIIDQSIRKMRLTAPRSGTIVYVTNWRSEKKKVGDSAWMGERIIEIPDLGKLRAKGEVDESDAGRVLSGQLVTLRLDANPETEFKGRILSVGQGVQKQKVPGSPLKVLSVKIALDRVDGEVMRPGMHFQGTVETSRLAEGVVIPARTLLSSSQGLAVMKRNLMGMKLVQVKLGRKNEEMAQVLSGLTAGDRILEPKAEVENEP